MKWTNGREKNLAQFFKFGLVGIINNIISYVTFSVFMIIGVHYLFANIIGFTVSVLNSYYWNNRYVFQNEGKRVWWRTLLKTYISYAGTGLVFSNILMVLWIEVFHISEFIAPIINLLFTVPINFIINKFWAYKEIEE